MTAQLDAHRAMPLFADYAADPRRYHEAFDEGGAIRPHWRALLTDLEQASPAQMRQRQQFIARQIRENGVTYNIYDDAKGAERPWDLDLLPHLIEACEWAKLAADVAQRASLLDAVLADLYGAQKLLREGLLPTELVYGHDDFLWPCQGLTPPGGRFLHVYAADLARAPDGRWWVLADRAQAPSGAGYALENRQIVSRAFADTFRDRRVQPLDGFFRALQTSLQRLAPSDGATPLAVLLTPGRYNETYFEHVYLARALGVPLVEGQDLTVRGTTLFLKTLGGLQRVHAILRRVDAEFCDPLELRGDSALGVPGLLEVARAGRVLIANALGSGVIESPGLLGFLPRICERLRGESLVLPAVATWWCGEAPARDDVLANLERLVIKPAFPTQRFEPVFGPTLSRARRAELRARILARPEAYVAQELVELSHAPVWQRGAPNGRLAPRAVSTRVYAVATENGYAVMPGGLTRVAAKAGALTVSMQRGGTSKDTWVLIDGAVEADAPRRRVLGVRDVVRTDAYLPSRLVENLFWLGRYSERSDNITRLLRVLLARYIDGGSSAPALASALEVCRVLELTPPKLALKNALLAAVTGGAGGGLRDTLERLFWAATQARGRLSQENWRGIVELQREATALAQQLPDVGDAMEFLNSLLMSISALSGFALDDMTHDEGWRFLVIGRRLERLQFVADVVAVVLRDLASGGARDEAATLDWLLELADSIITYRMRYLSAPQLIPALDLVVFDEANPHAVLFQVRELVRELDAIADDAGEAAGLRYIREQIEACALGALEESLLGERGRNDALNGIADRLAATAAAARDVSDRLVARHFAHIDDISRPTVST